MIEYVLSRNELRNVTSSDRMHVVEVVAREGRRKRECSILEEFQSALTVATPMHAPHVFGRVT